MFVYLSNGVEFSVRMDTVTLEAALCGTMAKNGGLNGARRVAMHHIGSFIQAFSDDQALKLASSTWAPTALLSVAEVARIHEVGHLRCRYLLLSSFFFFFFCVSSALEL